MARQSARKARQATRNFKPESIRARNENQKTLLRAFYHSNTVIAVGPAGTGKTFLCATYAAEQLFNHQTARVVLARPTVGVSKTQGFLPGRLDQKLAPWARPLTDAIKKHISAKKYEEFIQSKSLELCSIEHVRGLTFDDTILIIDEAQNTTPAEIKALLTRLGEDSRVFICGDVEQSDIEGENGLEVAIKAAQYIRDSETIRFSDDDVVRSDICRHWVKAFSAIGA